MSRRDYCALAEVIRAVRSSGGDEGTCLAFAERMARVFEADNPRFDSDKFYEAAGFAVAKSSDGSVFPVLVTGVYSTDEGYVVLHEGRVVEVHEGDMRTYTDAFPEAIGSQRVEP